MIWSGIPEVQMRRPPFLRPFFSPQESHISQALAGLATNERRLENEIKRKEKLTWLSSDNFVQRVWFLVQNMFSRRKYLYDVFFDRRSIRERWRKIQITFQIKFQFSATLNISVSVVRKRLIPTIFTSGKFMSKLELANFVIAKLWLK